MNKRVDGITATVRHNVEPMRVAWFTPLPPDPSGIAAYSQEVTPLLAPRFGALDLYSPAPSAASAAPAPSANRFVSPSEFVWRHRRQPYDLIVYQLGNSASHDFIWAYLFRYPGLIVLHDAQVHQARALWLLRRLEPRLDDYLAELRANHPDAPPDLGWLFAAGLGGNLFRLWPLVSLVIGASRLTAVHNAHLAHALAQAHPDAAITAIEMGVADPLEGRDIGADARALRTRLGIPSDACVIGAYGGITPEKRIPELLKAVSAPSPAVPPMHVLLVGQRAPHYDVDADVRALGLEARVHIAGYVADAELPAWMAAADVCCCLRWPSNGETSASWLRCLGAGRPTLVTALAQLQDVPLVSAGEDAAAPAARMPDAIGVAVDPLDEPRELPRVLASLAANPAVRQALGANARAWWEAHHTLSDMADAYERLIRDAAARPAPACALPAHLANDGTGTARRILGEMGIGALPW
ncbi:MAG: glycosyltransferase family 4 protein [Acidobacteria bacterium]|nr:glycosyltransferase family 4 protein [Acidobacteriota bacterium]